MTAILGGPSNAGVSEVRRSSRRSIVAIVNPISGRRNIDRRLALIGQALAARGASLVVERTERAGHAAEIAARCCRESSRASSVALNGDSGRRIEVPHPEPEAILIVGGDGTVNEVLQGMVDSHLPVAILATGTENLLAKQFRMPTAPRAVADLLIDGRSRRADLGRINGRRFAAVVGVGFDAECVERLSRRRKGHIGYVSYFWPIFSTFWRHVFPELAVEVDGRLVYEGRGLVIAGLIPRYAAGLRLLMEAKMDDGFLDVVVFECPSRGRLIWYALKVLLRRHVHSRGVVYEKGTLIRVRTRSSSEVLVEADGDSAGRLPIELTVEPRAIEFLEMR